MATSGTLKIIGENGEGESAEAYLYRCCDFFVDEMKGLIEKAFKGWHEVTKEGYERDQCEPEMIRAVIFAEKYQEAKEKGNSWHMCITPFDIRHDAPYSQMTLNVSNPYAWVLKYSDYDEKDNEIEVAETLTKEGWKNGKKEARY